MAYNINKSITDRAFTDIGTALFVMGSNGKYHFALPVTNMPATGSAPDQQEKTVTTDQKKTYIASRQDNPQREFTFYAHRDNFRAVKALSNGAHDFLQINPDFTGYTFSGTVSQYQDEVSVGNNITGKIVITVSKSGLEPIDNVYDLIEDVVVFDSEIPDKIEIVGTNTADISVATIPADATITAISETTGVATVSASGGKVTITGVKAGSAIVEITAAKDGYSSGKRTVFVEVLTA